MRIDYDLVVLRWGLLCIHHMLGGWLLLLLRVGLRMVVHMVVLMVMVVIERGVHEVCGTLRTRDDAIANGRLQFTTRVDHRRLVSVLPPHMAHARRVRPRVLLHAPLLCTIVRRVPDVHPVVGWKPGVGHAMHWLSVVRNMSVLVYLSRVVHVRVLHTIVLRDDCGAVVVLLVVFSREHTAILDIGHVRICKV